MFIIIGLGNPGQEYQNNRHNAGFMVLDLFKKKENFSDFILNKKWNAFTLETKIGRKKIVLVKPQT